MPLRASTRPDRCCCAAPPAESVASKSSSADRSSRLGRYQLTSCGEVKRLQVRSVQLSTWRIDACRIPATACFSRPARIVARSLTGTIAVRSPAFVGRAQRQLSRQSRATGNEDSSWFADEDGKRPESVQPCPAGRSGAGPCAGGGVGRCGAAGASSESPCLPLQAAQAALRQVQRQRDHEEQTVMADWLPMLP